MKKNKRENAQIHNFQLKCIAAKKALVSFKRKGFALLEN